MKGKSKQKTAALKRNTLDSIALPGTAGLAVMQKLKSGEYDEALNIFYDAYVGDLGTPPHVQILEDDGNVLIIRSQRGPFRFTGEGRTFFLMVVQGIEAKLKEQKS